MKEEAKIRLTINGREYVVTVEDGIAYIRGERDLRSDRNPRMDTFVTADGHERHLSLAVESIR